MKRGFVEVLSAHAGAAAERFCAREGCQAAGLYRAPQSRERLSDYLWFCLDHVRDYNRAWDYYKDMNADAIEAERRRDGIWRRPTWKMGGAGAGRRAAASFDIEDGFGFFDEARHAEAQARRAQRRRPMSEEEKALEVLGLAPPTSDKEIKARYKTLAKRLHPDANGGDAAAEERLKTVNQAYATLKNASRRAP